jgi:glycosyltransferase involved in cell wall biosynthesis
MKVLMFGWEFPPHISGGLGTACHGLTHALEAMGVKVLFTVPKLYGDEPANKIKLVDASAVPVKKRPRATIRKKTSARQERAPAGAGWRDHAIASPESNITYMDIPSALMPYQDPLKAGVRTQSNLTTWNYSFLTSHMEEHALVREGTTRISLEEETGDAHLLALTGTYGPDLMGEVERYAEVAGAISEKYSFDVIHAHDWMTFPAGIKAKMATGKPLIVHVHSTEFDRSGDHINEAVYRIEKLGFQEADGIITVSNWTKEIVMTKYLVPEEKITVVHNGVAPRNPSDPFPFPDIASHFVTFLGRVTHQKGPAFFVEAAQKVLQEFPEAHFIVAGAGDLLPQIIEMVARLNMSANFHFTGFLSGNQVDSVWSLTDVYVMPSVSEPFGIAPLEAIQSGVPVILSRQSGVSEVMPHAIKVDFWDTQSVAAAICSVLRYESLSNVLRQNSKKHIQNLTWQKAARDVKVVYHELTRKE